MNIIESLNWRYATKKFNGEKLPQEKLDTLMEAVRLSASSYGLQAMKVFLVSDDKVREKLRKFAWGQQQITGSSHLFVFAVPTEVGENELNGFISRISETRGQSLEELDGYKKAVGASFVGKPYEAVEPWISRQVYISLGTLLTTAAVEGVDACPMEGFQNEKFDEVLGLKEKGYKSVVLAAVGYRAEDDKYQHAKKVRKSTDELYEII